MSEGRGERYVHAGRLAWYARPADEEHWHEHWRGKVRPDYYADARRRPLADDAVGRLVQAHVPAGARLIEAGCGAGRYVAAFAAAGYDVDGVEYSEDLVALVNEVVPDLPVRHADALALDVADGAYDAYVSIGVVEHREEGPEPFLAEAHRVLAPGGIAVITVPAFGPVRRLRSRLLGWGRRAKPAAPFYQYGFTARELQRLVAGAGFTILDVGYDGSPRMLDEELVAYRWLTRRRGGERLLRRPLERLVGRRDGHMVAVVAAKPEAPST